MVISTYLILLLLLEQTEEVLYAGCGESCLPRDLLARSIGSEGRLNFQSRSHAILQLEECRGGRQLSSQLESAPVTAETYIRIYSPCLTSLAKKTKRASRLASPPRATKLESH